MDGIIVDEGAYGRLAAAIACRTAVQAGADGFPRAAFLALIDLLRRSFPLVHREFTVHGINEYSLVYEWPGLEPARKPALFVAHADVVPAGDDSGERWQKPPFAGAIAEGCVWGRGAMDDKGPMLALLEAAEHLLRAGHRPRRGIFFAFGHDEETGGGEGAAEIAAYFAARGLAFDFVLDEGLSIVRGMLPGVEAPVALIGLAEKGYLTVKLSVARDGGHSSMPEAENAVNILCRGHGEYPPPAGGQQRKGHAPHQAGLGGRGRGIDTDLPHVPERAVARLLHGDRGLPADPGGPAGNAPGRDRRPLPRLGRHRLTVLRGHG